MSGPPVWLELHVDDQLVERDRRRAPESVDLLRRVAALAESRGARLSFRFRAPLAGEPVGRALLVELAGRGHEIGVHAHGRGLAEAAERVRASGVAAPVATPGLVQAGRTGRGLLLRQAAALGFRLITDHGPRRAWAYEGLLGRAEQGLWVAAPTVRPTDWGLIRPGAPPAPLDREAARRLRALERRAIDEQGARFFGAALHEHDLALPGTLRPSEAALDALAGLLDARVGPSMALLDPARAPAAGRSSPVRGVDGLLWLARLADRLRGQRPRRAPAPLPGGRPLPVGRRFIQVERWGPAAPRALLLLSHGGREGGRRLGLSPFGLTAGALAEQGIATLAYDRAGTGASPPAGPLTPGNPEHTEDLRAVLALARAEGAPVIALSWSAGVLPVLRAAAAGERPDALLDAEGPADRWSLVPPEGNELSSWDPWEDARWEGLEPTRLLARLDAPYGRLQGGLDHVHGPELEHARRMVGAARAAGLLAFELDPWPGRLHEHAGRTLARILALLALAAGGGRD